MPLLILFVKFAGMAVKKEIVSEERRTGDLQEMSKLLGPLARKMLGKKAFAEADVICNWTQIAGEELAAFSNPLRIDFKKGERTGGILQIEAAGGAFALELQLKSRLLVDKVNTFFGYEAVKGIKIIQNPAAAAKVKQSIDNSEKKLVTKEEENYIRSLSGGVNSSELSQALQKLGCAVIANSKK